MHVDASVFENGLDEIRASPPDHGTVELIVARPDVDERELLDEGQLDLVEGLVGDTWKGRKSSATPDGSPHPDRQLTLTNARFAELMAGERERWALSGDQLYVDLDLSPANLPPGTRLKLGTAEIEITAEPHRGCGKYSARFGLDTLKFANSPVGRELNLRGAYAKIVSPGVVRVGDTITKLRFPR